MILQSKCGQESKKMLNYERNEEQEYCVECYTELHYYMAESEEHEETSPD